ncbi:hypothetical protein ACFE04_029954 [Oxalis oulophora]
MAELFLKQAKEYRQSRPNYPPELFRFIASKTPHHDLAWDAGTGSGQAAQSLSCIYKKVIATDTSPTQLEFAPKISNIHYQQTPPLMSISELQQVIASNSSVDLVTVATAIHWFDIPNFYEQVKFVLKKPNGVIAAWTYTASMRISPFVDPLLEEFYRTDCKPYWANLAVTELVDSKYRDLNFPFEAVDGEDHTGPFEFTIERVMGLDDLFELIKSWSAYPAAKDKGVELLNEDVIERFKSAWDKDGCGQKNVKFPVYLRIGKVGNIASG